MFSEPPSSSVPSVLSTSISPLSSEYVSPVSSASHSRTSTITSTSFHRNDASSSSSSHLTGNSSQRQMKIGKYFLERTIGKGNFAVVKLATHCDTHQKVAIKIIDKSRLEPADHKKLEREIAVMKSLVHPYIIRLYEVMESKNLIYLVTEYAANGELLDLLIRQKRLSEAKAREKFRQLVLAVEYIHSKNIVHRDLKAENLLLDSRGNIKVADFGFANVFKPNTKLQTFCGSPPYAAPELYQCLPYDPEKVDVWSLGVLLFVFVCGHLPFDSNNLAELRKRVLAGQFRLPFFISSDCSSLIGHMLTVDPAQRYSIQNVKNHRWLMLTNIPLTNVNTSQQSISNSPFTNAILDHAESLGYNRSQILKSVNGNSYDSDAAIWHLLLEKFQQTCHIDNSHIPLDSTLSEEGTPSDLSRRSTAPLIFDETNRSLTYSPPNPINSSIDSPPLDPNHPNSNDVYPRTEPEIRIDYLDHFDVDDDDDDDDDVEDEVTSAQLREQYARTHGLRRHTIARPDLLIHGGPIPALTSNIRFAHPLSTVEPSLLTNRLTNLQQQQQQLFPTPIIPTHQHHHEDEEEEEEEEDPTVSSSSMINIPHTRNPHSISYNGLFVPSIPPNNNPTEIPEQSQRDNQWLSPPVLNNFHMNRRASDSGAHLLLFQQQYGVTGSNTFGAVRPTHLQSPLSNRSSRGSITRGAPITPPTFSITPHEAEEDEHDDDDAETLARYLSQGKRHTVCEQGLLLGGKARRAGGTRELVKERGLSSRRASDTSSNFINSSARAHLERLYNNAVNLRPSDEDDLTASSLQELQKLQKQVQKYPTSNSSDVSLLRRAAAVPSPTNSIGLHRIQEEHQRNPRFIPESYHSQQTKSSSSSSSEGLATVDHDDEDLVEHEMECDVHHQQPQQQQQQQQQQHQHHRHQQQSQQQQQQQQLLPSPVQLSPSHPLFRPPYYPPHSSAFYCNTSPLLAQHLAIPTTTSSFMP